MKKLSIILLASMLTVTLAQAEMKCGAGKCGTSMKCGASHSSHGSHDEKSDIADSNLLSESHKTDGYTIKLDSKKPLVVGSNDIEVTLLKDGKNITDAKVKVKFFMPEMPGMPYMEYKERLVPDGDKYTGSINFSMSGTWQYQLKFKTADGQKHKIRGSVNL